MDVDLGASPSQREIKETTLDQYVVGQEQAKIALSVAVYNHYKRINCGMHMDDDGATKESNVLLHKWVLPAAGKTLLAQTLARY